MTFGVPCEKRHLVNGTGNDEVNDELGRWAYTG